MGIAKKRKRRKRAMGKGMEKDQEGKETGKGDEGGVCSSRNKGRTKRTEKEKGNGNDKRTNREGEREMRMT